MSLWKIAWRSIQQRALASTLTAISMGLGVSLVVAVLVIYGVVQKSFHRGGEGYDLIVGAKGSPLQLVLNSVFYLNQPVENIPYSYYKEFTEGRFAPDVEAAIPICMGHSYKDYRVVGTVPEMFTALLYAGDQEYEFAEGENFRADRPFDAVIGATVARQTGMKLGSTFAATHGVREEGSFTVVGILAPTGTPNDRALFVNMEGFYQVHAHAEEGEESPLAVYKVPAEDDHKAHDGGAAAKSQDHAPKDTNHTTQEANHAAEDHNHAAHSDNPDEAKQITAILVCVDRYQPGQAQVMAKEINQEPVAQAATPSVVIAELFEGIVGNIEVVLLFMAALIVVVAGIGIMVSIYNSMSDRRHEIAVMRALGASRTTVMMVILLESILLSLGGGAMGLLLGHGLIAALSPWIVANTGVPVGLLHFRLVELVLIPGLVLLASVVGYMPAVAAYRTDVARSLANTP